MDFIVKDSQLFSVVSDPSFCALVAKVDPTYILPSRQAVKAMAEKRYVKEKKKAKAALHCRYVDLLKHGCISCCHMTLYQ